MTDISMSWWLSQPVQEYLDAQLCHPKNRLSLDILGCKLLLADEAGQQSCLDAIPELRQPKPKSEPASALTTTHGPAGGGSAGATD